MTLVAATFRELMPEFTDPIAYPTPAVTNYINVAYSLLNSDRWGSMLDTGAQFFTAHFLALGRLATTGAPNSVPGTVVGVVNSGSVDKVSYGKDIASIMEDGAGHWGMTTYGLIYLRWARMMGMGGYQIGLPCADDWNSSGAWPGPDVNMWF